MEKKRLEFADQVLRIVYDLGRIIFDAHTSEDLQHMLGLTKEQMQIVIRRIVNTLPNEVFGLSEERQEEIKNICAREFMFFQAQEKWDDPNYKHNLLNFLHLFARDIKQQYA